MKKVAFITLIVLLIDQSLKIYIKTHFEIGESFSFFPWFKIFFIENPGMAYGIHLIFKNYIGKFFLSIFRLVISFWIIYYIYINIKNRASNYFIILMSLIFAGAVSNLIDSMFYGIIFDSGTFFNKNLDKWVLYTGVSKFYIPGYSFFMGGCVVDMLYFPITNIYIPEWIPFFGGEQFEIFKPIFNIADVSISLGVILLFLSPKKYFLLKF